MAKFPDFLYRLTPRDEQVTPLDFVYHQQIGNDVSDFVDTDTDGLRYEVPLGKMLLIGSLSLYAFSGAAGKCNYALFTAASANGNEAIDIYARTYDASTRYQPTADFNQLIIPEGWRIYTQAHFSNGAVSNRITGSMTGLLIPRGNFAI